MEEVLYSFPAYTQHIVDKVMKTGWFIHSFCLDDEREIYNPSGYLFNKEFNGVDYTIHLDLNIYQYVLSAFKKENKINLHRDAISLMVFGKLTNVTFDPTLAVYEKLNYLEQCPDEIIDDLILFRRIDNSNMESLAKFALGRTDDIVLPELPPINKEELKYNLTKYKRLKKWDSLYLFVLKTVELCYFDNSSNDLKIKKFLDWCYTDFLYSLVGISFVIKIFGNNSIPKLMKYKPKFSVEQNKKHIINMTWDLFILDKFFEKWIGKDSNQEFIYASNDKPLKDVLEIAISMQINGNGNHLTRELSSSLIEEFNNISRKMQEVDGREISNVTDFKKFRDNLIDEYEVVVLS
ncbi:hypothetical protein [Vibrio nigripulchritudo]|uniref:hypothetical protein n=1 Tax=Vibrio nigripulchritudo TaxID=28173 RepID=UPI0003B1D39C|nr:hypothetical protein [Vibrio nigripulchritudo]CCN69628.1 conserved hypothetical protein [Vibrio nigripulchritudo SFn118]